MKALSSTRPPIFWKYLCCLGLGLSSCLGFAPFNLFFITIFNIVISIYILNITLSKRQALYLGFYFGLGYHFANLYWISISFDIAQNGGYFLGIPAVFLLASFLALLHGLSFYTIRYFSKDFNNLFSALLIIFILSIFDWIKSNIFWGFPWTPLSAIWSFSSFTLHPFSIIGIWGYSLITFSLIVGIYLAFRKVRLLFIFSSPFLIIFFSFFFSYDNKDKHPDEINVRLVQPNIEQTKKWDLTRLEENLINLLNLSDSRSSEDIDLIIWPETSIPFDIEGNTSIANLLRKRFSSFNALIFGSIRREQNKNEKKIYNSLYFKSSRSDTFQIHDKTKLVPFGEFIPFSKYLDMNKLTDGNVDFQRGLNIKPIQLNENILALPLICYEVIFPSLPVFNKEKYSLLINITNDGWYGSSTGPYQHLALARIRAVQEGKVLIRVANTGISAIINYNGDILSELSLNSKGIIDKKIKLLVVDTPYKKHGESFFHFSILLLSLILVLLYIKKKEEIKC